ncbi:LPD38 domain-containing protein [Delftia deserti]|uniref:LPD38 domain-containing protein n=1 Tax=Delftia deserti TaxID=1651218 RepID=A0ABW5F0H2_9BURK
MAQSNEWWKQGSTPVESAASGGDWWKQGSTPVGDGAPKPKSRSPLTVLNDTAIEAANAAAGGVSAAANFVKPGNDVSGWIDKSIIQAGEAAQSDVVKASKQQFRQEVQDANGVGGELAAVGKYVAQNPLLAAAQAAGSFAGPGLAVKGAGLAARAGGLAGKAVETAGRAGGVAAGAAMAGGDAAGTAYDLAKQGGATEDQAVSAARGASVLPAVIGGAGGAFGAERLLAGGKGFAGGAAARALKTGASEAAQEGLEEGVTQYEGQRAAMPFDPSIDPSKGVAAAAGMGAALGGVTGASTSLLTGGHLRNRPTQAGEQAPDTLPDVRSYAATIDQMVLPESQQEYRDMLARATDESLSATEREAAANALHRAFNPDLYQRTRPEPLQLGNQPPERLISFPDGSVGRVGEVESYLANLPEDQREEARARIMGQSIREVNDPAAQQARRWWENYGDGAPQAPGPDYLAEVQAAVRSGTQFSTQQTVDTVRDAMEDAWLAQNVGADPAGAPAPGAGLQAADAMAAQLQGQFQQASEDAGIAAVDARVRTGRILSGLQNLLDGGAENSAQVLGGLNEGLARINEQPLDTAETQRVRRMVDAYMGFRGVGEPAPLPADRAPAVDPFADNAAMEALIPQRPLQRPSERMGINPADGPLSRGAAMAVDAGFDATQQAALQAQEIANAQGAQAQAAAVAAPAANPPAGPGALEAAGPGPLTQATGAPFAPQADQAQQAGAQPPQATGAPGAPAAGAAAAQEGLTNASTTTFNDGAQGGPAPGAQGQAQAAAARPANWRSSALPAGRVARSLGIDPKGKRLAQILQEVDAADAARAGQQQASLQFSRGPGPDSEGTAPAAAQPPAMRRATTFAEARLAAKAFQGKQLTNGQTGLQAVVSRNSLDKMLSSKAVGKSSGAPAHSTAVASVDRLFEGAILGWSKEDRDSNSNLAAVHRFFAPMVFDGRQMLAKITVKETVDPNHSNPVYTVEAVDFNEKSPAAQWVDASARADGLDLTSIRSAGDVVSLAQAIEQRNAGGPQQREWAVEIAGGADPKTALAQPRDVNPGRSTEDGASVGQTGADPEFSRNMPEELAQAIRKLRPPVSAATNASVRQAVNQLVGGMGVLPNSLGRIVVTTSDDIRANWEPLIGPVAMGAEGGGKAQGFYDPNTKTVFIISDHIVAGDELGVVAHELMHKHGPAVLGEEGWNQLHSAIGRWASAPEGSLERQVYNEAAARVQASGPELSTQELFPYAVQVALEMGVRPNALAKPGTVARWLDQVRKVLRQVWAKIAGSRSDFASQDLVNLAFGIAQRENPAFAGELDGAATAQDTSRPAAPPAASAAAPAHAAQGVQFSRAAPAAPATSDYSPKQARAAERVFGAQVKQTLAEKALAMRHNLGTKLRQGLVDQFAPLKEISEKAYILARMSKGTDGAVEATLLYGKIFLRDGVYDVDIKDGGFAKVLASLKGEHDRFFHWVAAIRGERLKAEGKENLMSSEDISDLKTLNAGRMADGTPRMPLYAAALRELNAYNEAALKVAQESGLIDPAALEIMKGQPYVPFYRLMEEDGGMRGPRFSSGLVNQQAWKKLKGGTQQLNADLLQNTLMNWSHLYAAAARNRASLETMDAAEKLGVAYQVPADTKGAVKVMREGVAEHWAVEDPYLVDAISAMSYTPSGAAKAMAPFKRLLTFGVTVNPTFKIRNLIRDSLSAIAQSDLSYNPLENVAKGWKATDKNSQTYASMLASGGIIKFGTQENTNQLRGKIERLGGTMLDKQGFDKLKDQMRSLWEVYEEFGDRTENVNRTALYERLRAKGLSHAEASFQARDLMDFSMSGKWETVRFLAQTVPFLNARLQGLYKLGRAAGEDPRRFAAMAGAVSLASLGLLAAYADDDDWKKREDFDRDNFWWFKIGDKAFRIPKPFEVGAIGTVAERTAELMMSEEMTGKRFGQRISDMVFNTFAMDPTPQAIKPFLDVYANKDSFSGRAIEGMADERLRPQDRYNERTSEVARLLGSWGLPDPVRLAKGEYSGLSPKQVDFLLRGYFGWLATVSTTATDTIARPLLDRGERPAARLRDTFVAGNFVEELPTGSSRYVTTMYEQAKDVEQAWASHQAAIKSGDVELARSIQEEEGPKLRNRMAINAAKQQMAELGQRAKKIEGDRLMSGEIKRERLTQIEQQRNAIAQRVAGLTD